VLIFDTEPGRLLDRFASDVAPGGRSGSAAAKPERVEHVDIDE
jgi:hypothetical protein